MGSHVLELHRDPDAVFRTFHKSRVRYSISRARREGVVIRSGHEKRDPLDTFYGLHLLTRRRLGVPIQPRRFFELLWQRMIDPGLGRVLIAEVAGRPIAADVYLSWNKTAVSKFNASYRRAARAHANHARIWEPIQRACEAGLREYRHFPPWVCRALGETLYRHAA